MIKIPTFWIPTITYIMNLLIKKIGLVLLPALFFACEDPTELGANLNPTSGNVSTHYVEIPVTLSQVRNDSILSSMRSGFSSLAVGKIEQQAFGTTRASIFTNVALPANTDIIPAGGANNQLDSVKLQFVWNKNIYGTFITRPQVYQVYRLTQPIQETGRRTDVVRDTTVTYLSHDYYVSDRENLGELLGQLTLSISPEFANNLDTTALNSSESRLLTLQLDGELAREFFNKLQTNEGGIRDSQQVLNDFFKGVAVVPEDGNTYLTSFNLADPNSGLFVYYKRGTESIAARFPFLHPTTRTLVYSSNPAYFGVEADRSGTPLANAADVFHMQEFEPLDGRVYFQGLSGLLPKLEFEGFKDLLLTQADGEVIAINRAVVEFDSVLAGNQRQPLPRGLELYFVDANNRRFPTFSPIGGLERGITAVTPLTYDVGETTVNYYQSDVVSNLERYLVTGEDRYLQAILYPGDNYFYEPNSFVIRPDQVKLKIWYTKLAKANL